MAIPSVESVPRRIELAPEQRGELAYGQMDSLRTALDRQYKFNFATGGSDRFFTFENGIKWPRDYSEFEIDSAVYKVMFEAIDGSGGFYHVSLKMRRSLGNEHSRLELGSEIRFAEGPVLFGPTRVFKNGSLDLSFGKLHPTRVEGDLRNADVPLAIPQRFPELFWQA